MILKKTLGHTKSWYGRCPLFCAKYNVIDILYFLEMYYYYFFFTKIYDMGYDVICLETKHYNDAKPPFYGMIIVTLLICIHIIH